jgi:predicted ATP-grasp superfamily ATP-dependent carboligase
MKPPCIVLGLETQIGLGIVRELGRAGVPVYGIAQERHAIGLYSRYLTRGQVVLEPRSEALIGAIRALGKELGGCCLIAVSEANLTWLAAHRNEFGHVQPIAPSPEALEIVLNKQLTLEMARRVGINVPTTAEPSTWADFETLVNSFEYPAVLKWKDPAAVAHSLDAVGLAMMKAEYVYSAAELKAVGERYKPIGQWPLVQQYCAGYGLGQFFYMHEGECIRRFQHRRIAEWPPEGGFSSVCDATPLSQHTALQEQSIALLKAIQWEGVAMVEYRLNPQNGEAILMEINGRLWGSFPLAVECGAGFALIAYSLASGLGQPSLATPKSVARCRMVATEIKRLVRIVMQPGLIADRSFKVQKLSEIVRFFADFFRPGVSYYVGSLADPKPLFADLANLARKFAQRG